MAHHQAAPSMGICKCLEAQWVREAILDENFIISDNLQTAMIPPPPLYAWTSFENISPRLKKTLKNTILERKRIISYS